ncbi:MAG: dihydrodipicolinate reductase [Paracoccaceae bacterium]
MPARRLAAFVLAALLAGPAFADGFTRIDDKRAFLETIGGRELRLPLFRIRLIVAPDGSIEGSALGWPVKGRWNWKDGFFCREMDWSGTPVPFNCQLVEVRGDRALRFTTDRGAGDSAEFKLREIAASM